MNRRHFLRAAMAAPFAAAAAQFVTPTERPQEFAQRSFLSKDGATYCYARANGPMDVGDLLVWDDRSCGSVRRAHGDNRNFAGVSTASAKKGSALWVQISCPAKVNRA